MQPTFISVAFLPESHFERISGKNISSIHSASDKKSVKKSNLPQKNPQQITDDKNSQENKLQDHNEKIVDLSYNSTIYKIGSKENPVPPYPRMARSRNYQGDVEITVISDPNGDVIDAKIYKSSNYPILDNSALDTVKKWHFDLSSLKAGQDNYYRINVPIKFTLN